MIKKVLPKFQFGSCAYNYDWPRCTSGFENEKSGLICEVGFVPNWVKNVQNLWSLQPSNQRCKWTGNGSFNSGGLKESIKNIWEIMNNLYKIKRVPWTWNSLKPNLTCLDSLFGNNSPSLHNVSFFYWCNVCWREHLTVEKHVHSSGNLNNLRHTHS